LNGLTPEPSKKHRGSPRDRSAQPQRQHDVPCKDRGA
jgi:hypothetical protein